jgi:dihydroflavonol-4-reductase
LGVELRPGDVTDSESVLAALPSGVEAVFHVAGNTSLWAGSHRAQYCTNVEGTRMEDCTRWLRDENLLFTRPR